MRTMIVGLTLLHLTLAQNASAQTNTYTPRGYPYDSSVCTGGYQACFNRYLKVGWPSAAASSYCSQACRDYPPARRSK
jgi:hypothetical protein